MRSARTPCASRARSSRPCAPRGTGRSPSGSPKGDAVEHAAALREAGADLVHVATGQATERAAAEYRRGHLTAFSDRIRSEARVATMVGGYLDTLDAANTIVGAGRADLCLLEPAAFA